jgi:hypothetical protein
MRSMTAKATSTDTNADAARRLGFEPRRVQFARDAAMDGARPNSTHTMTEIVKVNASARPSTPIFA